MNVKTVGVNSFYLPARRKRDYVYCLEHLELAFEKEEMKLIKGWWNGGESIEYIASQLERDAREIFIALFHMACVGNKLRPFAMRL